MLADSFRRKLLARAEAKGRDAGREEGAAQTLVAVTEAASKRGLTPADVQSVLDEAQEILRLNGRR